MHEINEDDFDRGMEICEILLEVCNQNNGLEFMSYFPTNQLYKNVIVRWKLISSNPKKLLCGLEFLGVPL